MSWVEEIGKERMTDAQVRLSTKFLKLLNDMDDGEEDLGDMKEVLTGFIDTGIYNLSKLKEAMEKL